MENREELLKKAYELGFKYEKTYRGCSQCVVAAIQDTLGIPDDAIFKAATGFAGGCGLTGIGICGGFAGGVMVLSQLSRAPEAREQGIPRLSDLRDSGSIEQDADIVLLLRRPCKIAGDSEREDRRLAIVEIAKNRNGPTQEGIRMNFEEDYTLFEDRTEEHGVDGFESPEYDEVGI